MRRALEAAEQRQANASGIRPPTFGSGPPSRATSRQAAYLQERRASAADLRERQQTTAETTFELPPFELLTFKSVCQSGRPSRAADLQERREPEPPTFKSVNRMMSD